MRIIAVVGVVTVLSVAVLNFIEVSGLRDDMGEIMTTSNNDAASDQKSVTWEDRDCFTRSVTTKRNQGEEQEEFCARHDAAVARDLQLYGVKSEDTQPPAGKAQPSWLRWYLKRNPDAKLHDRPGN